MSKDLLTADHNLFTEKVIIFILAMVQFAHILDFVVLMPLGPILMRTMHVDTLQFASLVSSYNFSAGVAGVLYAVIADSFDRKKLLMISMFGFVIGTLLCALADNFTLLLIARIIAGSFGGVLNGIVYAIVADVIPPMRRGKAMGSVLSAFSIASTLGVPIGLIIADKFNWNATFYFIALFSFIAIIPIGLYIPSLAIHINRQGPVDTLKRFFSISIKRDYFNGYFFMMLLSIAAFIVIPFLSPYAVKNIGIAETDLKYLYLVGGIFTIITSRLFGIATDKFGALATFNILAVASMLPIYLYTHAEHMQLAPFLVITTLFMTLVSGRFIPCMAMISFVPKNEDKGAYMAIAHSLRSFATAMATLVAGAIITITPSGQLENFDVVGLCGIGLTILSIFIAIKLSKQVQKKHASSNKI